LTIDGLYDRLRIFFLLGFEEEHAAARDERQEEKLPNGYIEAHGRFLENSVGEP
jgi:hypothetical protein